MSLEMHKLVCNGKQYVIEAVGVRGLRDMRTGAHYETLEGIEEGIFDNRPFVTIIDDAGNKQSMHANRFKIIKEKDSDE